ncbi:MAG: YdcF family protein [Bacteroidales bacterium]
MKKYNQIAPYGIIFLILAISILILISAGGFLVVEDEPANADIIVVLMGSQGERMLQAFDIYEAGYSKRIVMTDTYSPGSDALAERGIYLKNSTDLAIEIGIELGINPEDISVIPEIARSTGDEAVAVRRYIESENNIDTLILVTSDYHSRRSRAIFRRSFSKLENPVELIVLPGKYSGFNAGRWYTERESAKRVVMEYTRFLHFLLWERWKM